MGFERVSILGDRYFRGSLRLRYWMLCFIQFLFLYFHLSSAVVLIPVVSSFFRSNGGNVSCQLDTLLYSQRGTRSEKQQQQQQQQQQWKGE